MPQHAENAAKLRNRAEECRALAEIVGIEEARAAYLKLAESYDMLAEQETVMATTFSLKNQSRA